ncbi:MAG: T9SS type A sorting domain-containing protein [Ignavibacteriaceae bacterium]|jgi:hypothetical protein|nr:T9SS type A sorting domain-containing protein [Ignavibacteriaceae bacterium]
MRKLFSTLCISFVFVSITFAQLAKVEIPMTVKDSNGSTQIIIFGLDSTATSGIDWDLGESELPPYPPVGAWDARFVNVTGQAQLENGTFKDIRNAPTFPYSGTYTHRIRFQTSDPNWEEQSVTVIWDLPATIASGSTISNTAFGGSDSKPFVGHDSITVLTPVDYDRLNIVVVYDGIIPVELTSFTANVINNSVLLQWSTATELNNNGFEIERKTNGEWTMIGYVPGYGTITEPQSYSFIDQNVSQGTYTYRLKQLDFDGSFYYSQEVSVEMGFTPSEFLLSQNYPNPFNPSTTISFSLPIATNAKLTIYNQIGQKVTELVNKNLEAGNYSFNWNASNQSSGLYFYELQTAEFKSVKKMTLLK